MLVQQFFRLVVGFDRRDDRAFADAVVERKFVAIVGLADLRAFDDAADAEVQFCEVIERNFRLDRFHWIRFAVKFLLFFDDRLDNAVRRDFLFAPRRREIQKVQIFFLFNGVEEKIKPRSGFLIDQQPVGVGEKLRLFFTDFALGGIDRKIGAGFFARIFQSAKL